MIKYSYTDVKKTLIKVGLKKGQTIFLCPEIYKFGEINNVNNKVDYFKIFLGIILKMVGRNGTVVMNTYTFNTLRYNEKFIYEKTNVTSGKIAEYFLKMKGVVRSNHPAFSVAAIGKFKKKICSNNSLNNYGLGSPYSNFSKLNGKVLNLGQNFYLNPFLHLAEFNAGVSYCYNKFTNIIYQKNKKILKKYFSSFVRYKHLDVKYDFKKLKKALNKEKIINQESLGSGKIYLYGVNDFCKIVNEGLKKDQNYLLKVQPKYNKNKFPAA